MHTQTTKNIWLRLTILTFIGTLLIVASAHAQAIPEPVTPLETSRVQNNGTSSVQDAMKEKIAERKMAINQNMQDRIINLATNVTNRLKAGSSRMENIIIRIESRILKLKAENIDVTRAEAKLGEAKISLAAATTAIAQLGSIQNAITSDDFRGAFAPIRAQFMTIRNLLRQTHMSLQETVLLLKEAQLTSPGVAPSTTPASGALENRLEVQ